MSQKSDILDYNFLQRGEVLSERKLYAFLGAGKKERRVNSVTTPPALSAKLCELSHNTSAALDALYNNIQKLNLYNPLVYYIASLQFEHGLRISEVLHISHYNLLNTGHFYLSGAKGSNSRVYYSSVTRAYFIRCKKYNFDPFDDINRFFVYRTYKKFAISFTDFEHKHTSVTHAMRHYIAQEIYDTKKDTAIVGDFLRHKSKTSTDYYVDKKGSKK